MVTDYSILHKRRAVPLVMGIVNVTPDSFSDGGKFISADQAIEHGLALFAQGADIIDIGGESTRPGAEDISLGDEIARVLPVIEGIRKKSEALISIDTRKPEVAKLAIEAGANIWNDVSALTFAPNSIEVVASLDVPIVLMHSQGTPKNMQDNPSYEDVTTQVLRFLSMRIAAAIIGGVKRHNIIIDPGIGFGKTLENNLDLLADLSRFRDLGCPVLLGASRKSFIGKIDGSANEPLARIGGSLAAALYGAQNGAAILRVHDVVETVQALKVNSAIIARSEF
ncbi:MAG: Dihydropteroate synthase [Hyphomonadaceae bacterium]|nr:MAG: Dihydropteroate synthase [Hyphomonadaceae bacterium]KAF0186906.1 MAG: Dihydropteroate synthase [Hyphomonadaceae bacterium]